MADVSSTLAAWSSTTDSNSPSGATNIGTGLDNNLREIQGVIVRGLSHKGSDIASSTTPALGATEGLMHDITGTATITGWDTVRAGIWKIVKFEGALTLTHNATNLILPRGANITTADGDVAIFFSEGSGNWRCLSYFRAASGALIGFATNAETLTGSATNTAVTPAGLKSVLGLTKLNTGTVTNEATLDIVMTSYTGYKNKLLLLDLLPATDGTSLLFRVSTDGGSTYDATASDYQYTLNALDDNANTAIQAAASGGGATNINLSLASIIGNGSAEGISVEIYMNNTTSTAKWPRFRFSSDCISADATPRSRGAWGVGVRAAAQDTDAVRLLFSSGNIASGEWTLYGWN